jgi:acetyl esterase
LNSTSASESCDVSFDRETPSGLPEHKRGKRLKRRFPSRRPFIIEMGSRLWGPLLVCLSSPAFSATVGGVSTYTDVEYTRADGAPLALDAAIPQGAGPFPAVIVVHGGGWVRGDRRVDVEPLFEPLSNAGFAWFSISYRLMTDVTQFGAAVDDVEAAIRFVKSRAAEFHVDPRRIALIGESAGGQLAAMAALNAARDLKVSAVVALYAPTDLLSLVKNVASMPQWLRDNIQQSAFAELISMRLKQLSPIEHVRPDMPPFLFIHGTADPLVPFVQSQAMCDRMKAAGAQCEIYAVPGAGHGIRWWESSPEMSQGYKREMVRWLEEELSRKS